MSAIITYPDTDPQYNDSKNISLQKILQVLNSGSSGGGGGGGAIQVYENRAPAPPDDPTKPAVSFPTGGGELSQWPANGPAWV